MSKLSERKLRVIYSPREWLVDGLVKANEDFITKLANNLMLDELLYGEGDPKQFLIETLYETLHQCKIERLEQRLSEAKKERVTNNMALLLGERKVRFWNGDRFVFYRVDKGLWRFAEDESDSTWIPAQIEDEIKEWE